ncbi:hypothetical protein ACIRD8_35145 [Streptomyces sp. NPDC102451]|uniref:hypothetical protein n=1 Tax=Streptomyces sp. NPDC102451 TaxID=3366177 RepID=UPI003830EA21
MSPEQVDRVREMAAAGVPDTVIGAELGVHARTVLRARQRHDIPSTWQPISAGCGSAARYKAGCRCAACRAQHTARLRAAKAERYARREAGLAVFTHGASAYTNWGCRCPICRAEHGARMTARDRKRPSMDGSR